MSSDGKNGKEKRTRRRAAGVRKHQHIENVVVEETFTLSSQNAGARGKVGDGVYVSATIAGNKRFYGVLIDQPALKQATSLWLQDQAESLDLNRRIKLLKQQQQQEVAAEKTSAVPEAKAPETCSDLMGANQGNQLNDDCGEMSQLRDTQSLVAAEVSTSEKAVSPFTGEQMNPKLPPTGDVVTKGADRSTIQNISEQSDFDMGHTVGTVSATKRPLEASDGEAEAIIKRVRADNHLNGHASSNPVESTSRNEKQEEAPYLATNNDRPVQKFKYVMENKPQLSRRGEKVEDPGYRVLVATFTNVEEAACGDLKLARAIEKACEEGGNYLPGNYIYYYQYEVLPTVLASSKGQSTDFDLRTSMGLHTFLQNTPLPPWFPLSNLQVKQGKVLNMLYMKKDNQGNITWENVAPDAVSIVDGTAASLAGGTKVSMHPRPKKRYQIGVVGGGIAGVACCQELIALLNHAGLDYHVTLFEARSRLGGRLWTDLSFHDDDGKSFPVELGASWIHGIDDNPLAALAEEAGIDFVTASEEVQMLGKGMRRIDTKMDEKSGKLFDDLLDHAADDCWSAPETVVQTGVSDDNDPQAAVRWYSSVFGRHEGKDQSEESKSALKPHRIGAPAHRQSADRSIDVEMGKVVLKHKLGNFAKLSSDEHRMLMWNTKNIEYALGANIADLSMKYWDADDRHAFEGDHVLLKQGYSKVIDHMLDSIKGSAGNNFELLLDFPVGQVEYARKSTTVPYGRDRFGRSDNMVELSDSCSVTSQDGSQTKYFDFVVCACPLGVLKESIANEEGSETLSFQPPLPFSKVDAISNVGFGLLDKVYLKFPRAFWRQEGLFKEDDQCLFGNVSGVNPHHYMFFDIGRCLGSGENAPPILMSLISGQEAVACECLSDKELVDEVVTTLRTIFFPKPVPEPTSFRFTRWGKDKFSRGSYTFLPPGATDQDFHLLQSPVNGNGDSLLLEGSETMRLFFAGEHTTALHPSMAHGAMLSGMRAAKEVVATIQFKLDEDKDMDRNIPVALFRYNNPSTDLRCNLCNKVGGQIREGSLLAFKRGARQVLVHNNCAEYSPEVEVVDSKWKNVIRAVNRGKLLHCSLCRQPGATIGCTADSCYRVFHFSCSEDAGWRFERDGKIFYCDLHRKMSDDYTVHCDRISMDFYLTKNPSSSSLFCRLCGSPEIGSDCGQLLAFQFGRRHVLVHENCIKYTSICDTAEIEESRMGHEYKNIFFAIDNARNCAGCSAAGATIKCVKPGCEKVFHLPCAEKSNWNFDKRGKKFRCMDHRKKHSDTVEKIVSNEQSGRSATAKPSSEAASFFNHDLLVQFGAVPATNQARASVPGNLDMGGVDFISKVESKVPAQESDESLDDSDESLADFQQSEVEETMNLPLATAEPQESKQTRKMKRSSSSEPWGLSFAVVSRGNQKILTVVSSTDGGNHSADCGMEVVVSINGKPVGEGPMSTLRSITTGCLKDSLELDLEVVRI